MNHQSFRDVIVVNNPALLESGFSDALAISQLGIFLYDPKQDRVAIANPDFNTHRTIQFIQGTPELPTGLLSAVANASRVSKPVKGRKILEFLGAKASRAQNQVVAIGYDGVDVAKTLSAKCEESKTVFLKLSGGPIDQLFHTEGKGYVRQYSLYSGCCDDCGVDCDAVSGETMADDLVRQINEDPILGLGTRTGNKLIRAKKVFSAVAPVADANCTEYLLDICDEGDDVALGRVQSQYSGNVVVRTKRTGSTSTYQLILDSTAPAPTGFSNAGTTIVPECDECGVGFTYEAPGFVYTAVVEDADANVSATIVTKIDTAFPTAGATATKVSNDNYVITTQISLTIAEIEAAIEAAGGPATSAVVFKYQTTRGLCVLTTPTVTAWVEGAELNKFNKTYTITLKDNQCGDSRLAELQAYYPDLVISETTVGDCVRIYSTTVLSSCVPPGCPPDAPKWIAPSPFFGSSWTATPAAALAGSFGVVLESAYVDRVTGECAFDYWKYDAEPIFIEVSQHSQDYNDKPTLCAGEWPVTEIQSAKIATGVGSYVREQEAFFKGFDRKYRDENPIVRELQDSVLQTDAAKFYDQYTLKFEFDYHQSWFSEKNTDTYRLEFYFPEGTGKDFESKMNAYIASAGLGIDPVIL